MNSSVNFDSAELSGNRSKSESLELFLTSNEWANLSKLTNLTMDNLTDVIRKSQTTILSRDPIPIVTTVTVFYILIFIAGILGNLITCTVISRNKSMHTATNYYLFNLAISDLILLISGMPPDLYNIWYPQSYPFTNTICIIQGLLSETSANATVLTITAFTVERYIAICHPFRQHTMSKLSRVVKFILLIWMSAFILAIPQAMQFGVVDNGRGKQCTMEKDYDGHSFEVSGFLFFVGPMTAICVLYVLIGIKLNKSKFLQGVKRKPSEPNRTVSGQTRVIRMLIAVAVAFFLCWAPFHAQRLMAVYGTAVKPTADAFYKVYTALTYTSGILYFLSTCINPLLYNIMSYKFRDAFKLTLARQFGLGSKYQVKNHNYSALSRQNGSIRLTATVNNRHNTFSIDQLQKRESDLSLQDSAKAKAHRTRCVSVSSQSTLMTSLSKNDMFAANNNPLSNRGELQVIAIDDHPSSSESQPSQHEIREGHPGYSSDILPRTHHPSTLFSYMPIDEKGPTPTPTPTPFPSRNGSNRVGSQTSQNNHNGKIIDSKTTTIPTPTPTNNPKPITLESLSEKLRKGTCRVLSLRANNTIGSKAENNGQIEKGHSGQSDLKNSKLGDPAWDTSPSAAGLMPCVL